MRNYNIIRQLADDTAAAPWVEKSFPIIKIVLAVIICLCALALIVLILSQKTESDGSTNAITGQADTFYNRNKGESLQGKIRKTTIAITVIMFVLCIVFLIINSIYRGSIK